MTKNIICDLKVLDSRGITWKVYITDTGASIRSIEGLASTTYCITKENCNYCGARKAGSGVRNYNRLLKAYDSWDKKSYKHLMNCFNKHNVDYWTR